MIQILDPIAALAALSWQIDLGADEAIGDVPVNRYDIPAKISTPAVVTEIMADFPQLSNEQILACLGYSADKERKATVAL